MFITSTLVVEGDESVLTFCLFFSFFRVKELVEGISSFNSYSRGDATVLDGLCLGDVHPASW